MNWFTAATCLYMKNVSVRILFHMCWKMQLLALLSDSWHVGPLIKDLLQLKQIAFHTYHSECVEINIVLLKASHAEINAFSPASVYLIFYTEA